MSYQLFLGYTFEGTTDKKFLRSIIERTVSEILFQYGNKDVEIILTSFNKEGDSFIEQSINSIRLGHADYSVDTFFIHSDSDDLTKNNVVQYKFNPLYKEIEKIEEFSICNIIPVIPVHMTESWMLADFDLLKKEICTDKTKAQLYLSGNPESFKDPKQKIVEALRIVNGELPKKRRKELSISDLYQIIGQKIPMNKLLTIDSFKEFYIKSFEILKKINLIDFNTTIEI